MAYYFMVDTYISDNSRGEYDEYVRLVKPIVEAYGGRYISRTECITCLSEKRTPQRVILIEFASREVINRCFSSPEYKSIMGKRTNSVDSRAIIFEGLEE